MDRSRVGLAKEKSFAGNFQFTHPAVLSVKMCLERAVRNLSFHCTRVCHELVHCNIVKTRALSYPNSKQRSTVSLAGLSCPNGTTIF